MAELAQPDFGPSADKYEAGRLDYLPEQVAAVFAALGIKNDAVGMDIAAGTGKLSRVVAPHAAKLFCVEPDDAMRSKCLENMRAVGNADVKKGTAQATGLPDNSLDFITMGDAAHWLQPPEPVLSEFKRVLKKNGKIAVFVRYPDPESRVLKQLHSLLEEHCHTYALPDANKFSNEGGILDKKQGNHLVSENGRAIFTTIINEQLTKEKLLAYLQSRSSTNRWSQEHPEEAMKKVIDPLFEEFATDGVLILPRVFHAMVGNIRDTQQLLERGLPRARPNQTQR